MSYPPTAPYGYQPPGTSPGPPQPYGGAYPPAGPEGYPPPISGQPQIGFQPGYIGGPNQQQQVNIFRL